jgi:hypothetical protein
MFCAVHSDRDPLGSRPIIASKSRSSSASSPPPVPWAGTLRGLVVVGTLTVRLPLIDGVPPGSLMRRTSSRLKNWLSGPTM